MSIGHLCKAEAPTEAAAETVDFCVSKKTEGEKELNHIKALPFLSFSLVSLDSSLVRGSQNSHCGRSNPRQREAMSGKPLSNVYRLTSNV